MDALALSLLLVLSAAGWAFPASNLPAEAERSPTSDPEGNPETKSTFDTIYDINAKVDQFSGSYAITNMDIARSTRRSPGQCSSGICMWPKQLDGNVYIPYTKTIGYSRFDDLVFLSAFQAFGQATCIRFVPRFNENDYITFNSSDGCWSQIGRTGNQQFVSISTPLCVSRGVIAHELMHVLGFNHEHVRQDRDTYVSVQWNNILNDYESNFEITDTNNVKYSSYDYGSILHYGKTAYSKDGIAQTLVPIPDSSVNIGQTTAMSKRDLQKINLLYRCDQYIQLPTTAQTTSTRTPSTTSTTAKTTITTTPRTTTTTAQITISKTPSPTSTTAKTTITTSTWTMKTTDEASTTPKKTTTTAATTITTTPSPTSTTAKTTISTTPRTTTTTVQTTISRTSRPTSTTASTTITTTPSPASTTAKTTISTTPRTTTTTVQTTISRTSRPTSTTASTTITTTPSPTSTTAKTTISTTPRTVPTTTWRSTIPKMTTTTMTPKTTTTSTTTPSTTTPVIPTTTYNGKACGGKLTARSGVITTPYYPDQYQPLTYCLWTITATRMVNITFLNFELESSIGCIFDYMMFDDLAPIPEYTPKKCGHVAPNTWVSFRGSVQVIFVSDATVQMRGFKLQYTAGWSCDKAPLHNSNQFSFSYSRMKHKEQYLRERTGRYHMRLDKDFAQASSCIAS